MYICDDWPEDDIHHTKDVIRLGHRPALYLYRNINKSDDRAFVCPDDVAAYHAYKSLCINSVPALILGSRKSITESALTIRALKCTYNPYTPHIEAIVSNVHKLVPSLLGSEKPGYEECFEILNEAVQYTKSRLKLFHKGGMEDHHYHHTLYSILLRVQETLRSMKLLFDEGLYLNATSLVRNLYELTLTFYVDWLTPTQMHKYLTLSSVATCEEWRKECDKTFREQVRNGLTPKDAKKLYDAKMLGFRLASVVSEKARLFPLGEEHHRSVYSFLSKIVHQDFSMTARYAHTLEHGDESVFFEDARDTAIYCADIFTAAIVTRVIDDVGSSREYCLECDNG